jgi:hypothetical protein
VAKSAARGGIRYQRLVDDVQTRIARGQQAPWLARTAAIVYRRATVAFANAAAPAGQAGIQLAAMAPAPAAAAALAAPNPALP